MRVHCIDGVGSLGCHSESVQYGNPLYINNGCNELDWKWGHAGSHCLAFHDLTHSHSICISACGQP